MEEKLTGYELSRNWFDWCFENPEKVNPNHTALYFFCIEHYNRLGGKEKFGLPTTMAKDAIGIKSYTTYIKTLRDLVEWGFVKMIQISKNQYSSNIVALSKKCKAHSKALDKAFIKHLSKQVESTSESNDSIDKPINNKPITKKKEKVPEKIPVPEYSGFVDFWLKEFHPDWEFKKIDGAKMKSIIEKIKTKISKSENPEAVPIEAFKVICNNLPTFYKSAQLSVIDSHLDTIIDEIKNKKNGSNSTGKQTRSDRVEKGMAGWRAIYDEGTRMQAESGESGDNQHGFDDTTNLRPTGSD